MVLCDVLMLYVIWCRYSCVITPMSFYAYDFFSRSEWTNINQSTAREGLIAFLLILFSYPVVVLTKPHRLAISSRNFSPFSPSILFSIQTTERLGMRLLLIDTFFYFNCAETRPPDSHEESGCFLGFPQSGPRIHSPGKQVDEYSQITVNNK